MFSFSSDQMCNFEEVTALKTQNLELLLGLFVYDSYPLFKCNWRQNGLMLRLSLSFFMHLTVFM